MATSVLSTSTSVNAPAGEAPYTLDAAPPRTLGFFDQFALWGNLAVSLALPIVAPFMLVQGASLAATVLAVVVGVLLGSFLLGLAAVPGAATGAPAMVVLRGLLGAKLSYVPTVLNVLQCIGWAVVEIIIIAEVATALTSSNLRWVWVLVAGALATALAVYPLSVVKRLRKYVFVLVLLASAYLFVQVVRGGIGPWNEGSWSNFMPTVDLAVGMAVSWAPLAADYSRHSRSTRAAFGGAFAGYATGGIVFFLLGIFAVAGLGSAAVAESGPLGVPNALMAAAVAVAALLILVIAELDEAFANVYSTAMSAQNIAPRLDRRVLALAIGVVATAVALIVNLMKYEAFLFLIGSVFVPLAAVLVVTFFRERSRSWNTSAAAPSRPALLVPWVLGFVTYQLVHPTFGVASWWMSAWTNLQKALNFTPQTWMSASLLSFVVAALATLVVLAISRPRRMAAAAG